MKKWTEYDPETGITEIDYASDDDDKLVVQKIEDVEGLLDRNQELRNSGATDVGIKKGLWHVASIPVTVQYELLKKGINIFQKDDHRKMWEEINANYPYLKTTNKTHSLSKKRPSSRTKATSTKPGPSLIVR